MSDGPTRRRRTVLGSLAAGAAALAGCGNPLTDSGDDGTPTDDEDSSGPFDQDTPTGAGSDGQDDAGTETESGSEEQVDGDRTIRLGGETAGWVGEEPESIAGETNPTLELEAEATYELIWDNLDGEEHELVLADENGDEVEASEESTTEGESVSMEFTAGEDLAEYFCEYHPESMRGDIEVTAGE